MQSLSLRLAVSTAAVGAALCLAVPLHAQSTVAEKLTDRCSVQVVIKNPYADNANIDPSDVLLDRSGNLGTVGSAMEAGHYVKGTGSFSAVISPVPVNGDRYFRWYCGTTAERSRCPSGTKGIKAKLGKDRLFETVCLK